MNRRLLVTRQNVPHHDSVTYGPGTCDPDPKLSFKPLKTLALACFLIDGLVLVLILAPSCTCIWFFNLPSHSSDCFCIWHILCNFLRNVSSPFLPNSLATLTTNLNAGLPFSSHLSPSPRGLEPKCTDNDRCAFSANMGRLPHLQPLGGVSSGSRRYRLWLIH